VAVMVFSEPAYAAGPVAISAVIVSRPAASGAQRGPLLELDFLNKPSSFFSIVRQNEPGPSVALS
jgi:hypothetical protein